MKIISSILTVLIVFCSCSRKSSLDTALELAGDNRPELEKLLHHYSQHPTDSLKLKAAIFLLENMVHHYSLENDGLLSYYDEIAQINYHNRWENNANNHIKQYNSLNTIYAHIFDSIEKKKDIISINTEYLINNIDGAYDAWQNAEWAKHLSFEDFCDYLLPYRIGNEPVEVWRDTMKSQYLHRILWVKTRDNWRNSTFQAATFLNDQIKSKGFRIGNPITPYQMDLPPSILTNIKTGTCEDYAAATVFIMRSCGIPVTIDYVPQWATRSRNHTWNVLLSNEGKWIPFMGGERSPGQIVNPATNKGKVFRRTYSYQKNSLFNHNREYNEPLPPTLESPFIKDVSEEYFDAKDIEVELTQLPIQDTRFVYLAVFDNQEWVPVQWAMRGKGNKVIFRKMEHDIACLPVYYSDIGVQPAGNPIILTIDNKIKKLQADTENIRSITISRKYPVVSGVLGYSDRMKGGRFEASNNVDFTKAKQVGYIEEAPYMCFDSLHVDSIQEPYRYWRFIVAHDRHCNVAELEFYSKGNNINEKGKIIADESYRPESCKEKAFDNDGVSYYEGKDFGRGWVGLDFGEPVHIDKIRYLPPNDDNNVWKGDTHELFYHNGYCWMSLGKQVAKGEKLNYDNVPANALLLLRNLTKGQEERIFTYVNGKQVWW